MSPKPIIKLKILATRMSQPPRMRAPPKPMDPIYPVQLLVRWLVPFRISG